VVGLAARGEDATALAQARRPDLVLIDVRLAGVLDGVEAAEAIRRECGAVVIFLTASSDPATLQRCAAVLPAAVLRKPFTEIEIETAIEAALNRPPAS
jgi:CheY-like chemotaxis protein